MSPDIAIPAIIALTLAIALNLSALAHELHNHLEDWRDRP